jgi:tetratricopeptide (TPR) repeat protein
MMTKRLLTISNLTVIIFCILVSSFAHAEIPDTVLNQKDTIVNIYVHDEDGKLLTSGGGFIVDQDGVIATNCNVIIHWLKKLPNTLVAETHEGLQLPIDDLISSKCVNNLALIKVKTEYPLPAANIKRNYRAKEGNAIFVVKRAPESEPIASDGTIKNVLNRNRLMQISIPVLPEESGAPVFNRNGEAIAALTFLPKKSKKRYFAVALDNTVKQLNKYKKRSYELAKKVSPGIPPPGRKTLPEMKEKPDDARDYFLRGCSYHELGMYSEAVKYYQKAIKLESDFLEAFINLGVAYYQLGKYPKAINAYEKAVYLNPHSSSIYNKLGSAYIIHGRFSKALDSFKKATEIEPENPVSHYNLGIAYYLNGERDAALMESGMLL